MLDATNGSWLPPPAVVGPDGPDHENCSVCGEPVDIPDIAFIVFREEEDGENIYICRACADTDWEYLIQ